MSCLFDHKTDELRWIGRSGDGEQLTMDNEQLSIINYQLSIDPYCRRRSPSGGSMPVADCLMMYCHSLNGFYTMGMKDNLCISRCSLLADDADE
jgi:hypothetical protein